VYHVINKLLITNYIVKPMAQCNNCNSQLGCGCQARTASNGASVCVKCINAYEANLAKNKK